MVLKFFSLLLYLRSSHRWDLPGNSHWIPQYVSDSGVSYQVSFLTTEALNISGSLGGNQPWKVVLASCQPVEDHSAYGRADP